MSPISEKVVSDKVAVIRQMIADIKTLPLDSLESFLKDRRMVAAGESYLRRCLEALLDLGRDILAKVFSDPVSEYREIGKRLGDQGVLNSAEAALLVDMGRYRNRLTHFYQEVTSEELYQILTQNLGDIERVLDAILSWLLQHPELVDTSL